MKSPRWNKHLAYAVGLIVSDGNLSSDGRHIEFTSKDKDLVKNLITSLNLSNSITKKSRGGETAKRYFRVQFGNVVFYRFLNQIGIQSKKSLIINVIKIPDRVFDTFLRGVLDGDGSVTWFKHPESKHPQLRTKFSAGNIEFLVWLKSRLHDILTVRGAIYNSRRTKFLYYAIADSIKILKYIYKDGNVPKLKRKYLRARKFLADVAELA